MSQYMGKTVFAHEIAPYFDTNGISLNQRAWFTAKDIPSNSPDVRASASLSGGTLPYRCIFTDRKSVV